MEVLLHEAAIALDKPDMDKLMGPLKEPPVVKVKRSVAVSPCATRM
jgi:hypothetical protein